MYHCYNISLQLQTPGIRLHKAENGLTQPKRVAVILDFNE